MAHGGAIMPALCIIPYQKFTMFIQITHNDGVVWHLLDVETPAPGKPLEFNYFNR